MMKKEITMSSALADGKNPAQWAWLLRLIRTMNPRELDVIVKMSMARQNEQLGSTEVSKAPRVPLVSIGPSGIGGEYQKEW